MFHEYAIDPAVFTSFDRVRFFLDAMKPSTGRLLSLFPKDWGTQAVRALPDGLRKQATIERFITFKPKMILRKGPKFNTAQSWVSNAIVSNPFRPFRAVVTEAGNEAPNHVCAETVDETHDLWQVPNEFVPRNADDITRAISLLLRHVAKLVIIDPYLRKCSWSQRELFTKLAAVADEYTHFFVYCAAQETGDKAKQELRRNFAQLAHQCLRGAQQLTVSVLNEKPNSARLHNRYFYSRIGGVQFGDGIEKGYGNDSLSILSQAKLAVLDREYCEATSAFTKEDTFTISASR